MNTSDIFLKQLPHVVDPFSHPLASASGSRSPKVKGHRWTRGASATQSIQAHIIIILIIKQIHLH